MSKPFASSADTDEKVETLEVLADGVYALTAQGDSNVGAIEGEDFLMCFQARGTPVAARSWLQQLRKHTDEPVKFLVLTHYHAVRVLRASAFQAETIISIRAMLFRRGSMQQPDRRCALELWSIEKYGTVHTALATEAAPGAVQPPAHWWRD